MKKEEKETTTLKDLLLSVVRQLEEAEQEREKDKKHKARLGVERVEVELKVQVSHKGKAGMSFHIVEAGYEGAKESISTLKISLAPLALLLGRTEFLPAVATTMEPGASLTSIIGGWSSDMEKGVIKLAPNISDDIIKLAPFAPVEGYPVVYMPTIFPTKPI